MGSPNASPNRSLWSTILLLWSDLPSLKLTAHPWKLMVGSWNTTFLLGFSYFQGRTVSFREGISSYPLKDLPFQRPSTLPSCDVIQTPSRLGAWSSSHGLGEIETFLKHILIYAHIMISYIHSLSILINPYQSLSILINPYQSFQSVSKQIGNLQWLFLPVLYHQRNMGVGHIR